MAKIIIPTPLRKFTANQSSYETSGETVKEAIQKLTLQYTDLEKYLFDDNENLRSFIRIYVGDEDIASLDKEDTRIYENSVISIIPAIAGG